ncbi:5'-nucleotidase C-terminal domain-containing protein [Marinifilum sp. RC60d5]|uniref:5'-nucleotidase C-terminal domain-containing protein n=1 Tax=Marinifilum sp. RC60d5 TaxID=3458414 RepID=UPI004035208A
MIRNLFKTLWLTSVLAIFISCSSNSKINNSGSHYTVNSVLDESAKIDTSFLNLINTYKVQLDDEMNAVIAYSDFDMIAKKPESLLSNFIVDAMYEIGNKYCNENNLSHSVDIAIMNMGGIRTALPKGEITTGRVFEMLPFKNKLVIVGMKGKDLKVLLNELAQYGGEGVSHLKMGIKNKKMVSLLVDNQGVDPERIYYILTVDYLANGGAGIKAFETRETFRHLHRKLRSEIIKYMIEKTEKGQHISSKLDERIYHVE